MLEHQKLEFYMVTSIVFIVTEKQIKGVDSLTDVDDWI